MVAPINFSKDNLSQLLEPALRDLVSGGEYGARVFIVDDHYQSVEVADVLTSISLDPWLAPNIYHADVFDCDDFVMYLRTKFAMWARTSGLSSPLALGFILTVHHAFNFCVDASYKLNLINTQSEARSFTNKPAEYAAFLEWRDGNPIQLIYV